MNPAPTSPTTILYGGTVKLDFNAKSHSYLVTDERGIRTVPSVTQILGIIDKSGPLTQWAANMTTEYIKAAIRPGTRYDEIQLAGIIDQARFNFRSVSRNAKSIGQLAHEWIEGHLRARLWGGTELPLPVNEQARAACQAAAAWIAQHFTPRTMEHRIYSRESEFAGTLDVCGEVDGFPAIVDWKASAAIYREFRLQTAAYAAAWAEMCDERVPNRWVIRLDKESGEFEAVQFPREDFKADLRAFLAAKALSTRLEAIKTPRAAAAPRAAQPAAAPAPVNRPMAPTPAFIPSVPVPQQHRDVSEHHYYEQQKGPAPAVDGYEAPLPSASSNATVPQQQATQPRRSRRRVKQINYLEMNSALVLSGATFPIKDDLARLGGRRSKTGDDWIWQLPIRRYGELAGLCAQNSIQLVAASGELHVQTA